MVFASRCLYFPFHHMFISTFTHSYLHIHAYLDFLSFSHSKTKLVYLGSKWESVMKGEGQVFAFRSKPSRSRSDTGTTRKQEEQAGMYHLAIFLLFSLLLLLFMTNHNKKQEERVGISSSFLLLL